MTTPHPTEEAGKPLRNQVVILVLKFTGSATWKINKNLSEE